MAIERKHVGPRLSQMVIHGDTIYLAGIVADHAVPDVAGQTGQILDKIDQYLKEPAATRARCCRRRSGCRIFAITTR